MAKTTCGATVKLGDKRKLVCELPPGLEGHPDRLHADGDERWSDMDLVLDGPLEVPEVMVEGHEYGGLA